MSLTIPLFVALPLGVAFLLPILKRIYSKLPDIVANVVLLIVLVFAVDSIGSPLTVYKVGGWMPVNGVPIGIHLVLDGLSAFMLVIVNLIGFLAALYSVEYMEKYTEKTKYYILFLLMVAGMNGVILAGDMFNLFVFLEIAAIASYALVAFGTEAEELEASFKYQVMGTIASGMILLGISLLYAHVGTLNMADTAQIIAASGPNKLIYFVACLFVMGFGLKAAIMPFHAWLPDAHPSAPAPISAMLSGVLIKAIGVYALARIFFNVLGFGTMQSFLWLLMILGSLSMVAGALLAIGQKDFKRLLAYSSISQIGFIIFAFGLGTPLGFLGGLFHLLNHAVFKGLLFLNSGAIDYAVGTRDLRKMGGLAKKMPTTGKTSLIASMSIAGIPPFNGFWSKLIIIIACVQAGKISFAVFAIIASILTLASFLKVQKYGFFDKISDELKNIKEVPMLMRASMIVLAVLCVIGGVLLVPEVKLIVLDPPVKVLMQGLEYSRLVLGG